MDGIGIGVGLYGVGGGAPAGRTLVIHDDEQRMEMIDVFLITSVTVEKADATKV